MSSVRIRDFEMSDYPGVKDIWKEVFTLRPVDDEEHIKRKLERDPELFLVAEKDGRVVGVVFASYDGRQAIVHRLAVLPEYQRRGFGSQLMSELLGRLGHVGETRIMAHAGEEDVVRFFERFGFEESGVRYLRKDTWKE